MVASNLEQISEEEIMVWKRVQRLFNGTDKNSPIVDVPNYYTLPADAQKTIDHIHSKGKCVKNRYGPQCEWPD